MGGWSLYFLPLPAARMFSFIWNGRAPSLQAKSLFWEAENALEGVDEKLTVPWWGQLTLGPPVALIHQQPLGMGLGSWNVLHEAPCLAPPLLPFSTPLPLGAAAPGLEDRRKTAGEEWREA